MQGRLMTTVTCVPVTAPVDVRNLLPPAALLVVGYVTFWSALLLQERCCWRGGGTDGTQTMAVHHCSDSPQQASPRRYARSHASC